MNIGLKLVKGPKRFNPAMTRILSELPEGAKSLRTEAEKVACRPFKKFLVEPVDFGELEVVRKVLAPKEGGTAVDAR